jgi:hypothetical protein
VKRAAGCVGSGSDGSRRPHAAGRRSTTADGGGRQRAAAASPEKPNLGFSGLVRGAESTYAQHLGLQSYLGRRCSLGSDSDGAPCGDAARCGGGAPASYCGRRGAQRRPQTARLASSPPCASPGLLLDGKVATTAGNKGGGGTRVSGSGSADAGSSGCSGEGVQGAAGGYK